MNILKGIGAMALVAGSVLPASSQSQGDPLLFGYQYNMYVSSAPRGMYMITTTGDNSDLLWKDKLAVTDDGVVTNNAMVAGWIRNGVLCGYESQYPPVASYYKYVERSLETGDVIREEDVDLSSGWTNCFMNAAYCPDDDRIYGYGFNAERTAFAFKSAPADKPNQAVVIKDVGTTYPGSICYNHETGSFYGILNERNDDYTYTNSLVSIDVNSGQTTKIQNVSTGAVSDYKCTGALIWVPARQAYLWNFYTMFDGSNPCSQLLEVNPVAKTTSLVRSFDSEQNFYYFVAEGNDPVASRGAPAEVDGFNATMASGNTATVSFSLPVKFADGGLIDEETDVKYVIYVDGSSVASGSGKPGEDVSRDVTLSDGTHFIRVVPTVNNVSGTAKVNVLYVGDDSPCAPENIILTEKELVWDAVTSGIAGNPISDVTYIVEINGMTVTETDQTSFGVEDVVLVDGDLTNYRAGIRAIYKGRISKTAYSNDIIVGNPWTVPFTIIPDEKQFSLMIQEDVDKDNVKWSLDKEQYSDDYVLTSGFSKYTDSEDWIFLPKFVAGDKNVYSLDFNVFLADMELAGARVEAWVGDAPSKSAMKKVIVPSIRIMRENSDEVYTGEFTADGELAGKDLYIGIGVRSESGVLSPLRFRDINVKEVSGVTMAGPAAVGGLSVSPVPDDKTKSRISFTLPARTLAGDEIPASASVKAVAKVYGGESREVSGKPGEAVSVDLTTGTGDYMVTVTPECDGRRGLSANCVAGLGYGVPGLVRNVRVAYDSDNLAMRLDWDVPDTDVNGNAIEDDQFSYNIWMYNAATKGYELAVNVPYPLQFATVFMEDDATLQNIEVGITAINAAGESPSMQRAVCQIGAPHSLPIEDDFNGDEFRFGPITNYVLAPYNTTAINWGNPSKANWGLSADMKNADGDVLCGIPSEAGAKSRIDLPKVSTEGFGNVSLVLDIWTGDDAAVTTVKAIYPSSEPIEWENVTYYPEAEMDLPAVQAGEGYRKVTIDLPGALGNQPWLYVALISEYPSLSSRFILDGYALTSGTGVEGVTETLYGTVSGRHGMVSVTGYDGHTVRVYGLDGTMVASSVVSGNICDIPVEQGIYVVKVADRVAKVVVR